MRTAVTVISNQPIRQSTYLLLFEGQRLAVWVRFDAAGVMRSCAVEDAHQALQRVLQVDVITVCAMTRQHGRRRFDNDSD